VNSFWQGFTKQAGWKKNLAIGAGAGAVAGIYGLKRHRNKERLKALKYKAPTGSIEIDLNYKKMDGKYK